MAIHDQTRTRKTYSFYRTPPVPVPTVLSSGGSGDDVLIFSNIAEMAAYAVSSLSSGRLAFVQTVRDYFTIEKSISSGSVNLIDNVLASDGTSVWRRLGMGGSYWKNQLTWYVNAETGSDENLGSSDKPIQTIDELTRRLLGVTRIRDSYTVNLTSLTQSIQSTYALAAVLEGGTVTFQGSPAFSASIATINAASGSVSYSAAMGPFIVFTTGSVIGSDNMNLLYASSSQGGRNPMGWAMGGGQGTVHTTPFTTGNNSNTVFQSTLPRLMTPAIIVRGQGSMVFNLVMISGSTSTLTISATDPSNINTILSDISANSVLLEGGNIVFDRSRIRSLTGNITITDRARVFASGSGFMTPSASLLLNDSRAEVGSTVFWQTPIKVAGSTLVMSVAGSSGSALLSSSLEFKSNCIADVKNLIMSRSTGITNPVTVTGQSVTVFFDDSNQPKADTIAINNGIVQVLSWSQMPYQDLMRRTLIVSGSLNNLL